MHDDGNGVGITSGHAPGNDILVIGFSGEEDAALADDPKVLVAEPKVLFMMRSKSDLKVVKRAWISCLPSETEQQEDGEGEDTDTSLWFCGCG